MKTIKIKTMANSFLNDFVKKQDIIIHLGGYGINLENVKFNIIKRYRDAYGEGQYQIIEIPEIFYRENIKSFQDYKKKYQELLKQT